MKEEMEDKKESILKVELKTTTSATKLQAHRRMFTFQHFQLEDNSKHLLSCDLMSTVQAAGVL